MFTLIKRIILYVYIICTKYKQRNALIGRLKQKSRPQRDVTFDKPGIPDLVDDLHGLPDGWSDVHSFVGFDKDGTVIRCHGNNSGHENREVCIHMPSVGTLVYSETDDTDNADDNERATLKTRLKMKMVDPMMTWAITYRGHMKNPHGKGEGDITSFVRFNLQWKTITDPFDFWLDPPSWSVAGECCKLSLRDGIRLLASKSVWFEQWGELRGTVRINDDEFKIRIPACRQRKLVPYDAFEKRRFEMRSQHFRVDTMCHLYTYVTLKYGHCDYINLGYVLFPSRESYFISKRDDVNGNEKQCDVWVYDRYKSLSETLRKCIFDGDHVEINYMKLNLQNSSASGVTVKESVDISSTSNAKCLPTDIETLRDDEVLILDLSDKGCEDKSLVGGKAANLYLLLNFGFNVPQGFCITTNALIATLNENPELADAVGNIKATVRKANMGELKRACEACVYQFKTCRISSKLKKELEAKYYSLTSQYGESVAVRSSAIGEDGQFLSAAGQLDSILGVKGFDNVTEAMLKCWGSYFTFKSVEYRRQNGQNIVEGIAIVVQNMVASDTAGVMMTNDPVTGREDRIIISACLGLGETVVSGKDETDSVVVEVKGSGEFAVLKRSKGRQAKRIDISTDGGTLETHIDSSNTLCLSNDLINRLSATGKSIERKFKLEQDIEWAISEDTIFILQTRPITSFVDDTEDDLYHEFDTPATFDKDLITTCNIQEMMPGATTPLTVSYFLTCVSEGFFYVNYYLLNGFINSDE